MTWSRTRRQFGERINCQRSRFVDELPQDDIEWVGGSEEDAARNESRGRETLASLQALLD
jgi:ATP-dependent DNA helicase Rep